MKKKNKKECIDFNLEEFDDFEAEREYKIRENEKQRPGKLFFWCCWGLALIICVFALGYLF